LCPRYVTPWHGPHRKHGIQQFPYWCAWTLCRGNLFVSRSLPSKASTRYIAPSFRLFGLNSLPAYRRSFFSEGCACGVCDRFRLPSAWLDFHGDYFPITPAAPSLNPLISSSFFTSCQSVHVYYHHRSFIRWGKTTYSGPCCYISCSYYVCNLIFRFREGRRLHTVNSFIFLSLIEISTTRFTISSPKVCLRVLLNIPSFPRRSYCLVPRAFISLLHSGRFRPLGASLATLSLPDP
jgi:hypothetical protein